MYTKLIYSKRCIFANYMSYNINELFFYFNYLTFIKFCCIMTSVIELQDPVRTATKGVPAGTPLLIYGGYYGSIIPYIQATN